MRNNHNSKINFYFDVLYKELPVLNRTIKKHGNTTLNEYTDLLLNKVNYIPLQDRNDLFDVLLEYVSPLLGKKCADEIIKDIQNIPAVLTANHFGANYFSQSIQSCLIFALPNLSQNNSQKTVPVFSCGNVPLNNAEFPRGFLLYDSTSLSIKKVPIFPDRMKRQMVCRSTAITFEMMKRVSDRLKNSDDEDESYVSSIDTLKEIIQNDYCSEEVLKRPDYSSQLVILSKKLWNNIFSKNVKKPQLVHLEMEHIVAKLLIHDLNNTDSLVSRIMFNSWTVEAYRNML